MKSPRTIVIVAFTGRIATVDFGLELMARNLPRSVMFGYVGSSDEDNEWAFKKARRIEGRFVYTTLPNNPVGAKWAMATSLARQCNADLVIVCGSDDILSWQLVNFSQDCLLDPANDRLNMLSLRSWYIYEMSGSNVHFGSLFRLNYLHETRGVSLGAGRVYHRRFLERVDWEIFDRSRDKGLDTLGESLCDEDCKYYATVEEAPIISLKGPWESMNTSDKIYGSAKFDISGVSPFRKKDLLNSIFNFSEADLVSAI